MHIFSGIYKSRKIDSPKGLATRPTSGRLREAIFNIYQGKIEGVDFLDLFAGSGAMGLEAISRGAKRAVFVDNNKESIKCIKANVEKLGVQNNSEIIYGDVFSVLKSLSKRENRFDVIYADPPYDTYIEGKKDSKDFSHLLLGELDCLVENGLVLLKDNGDLFLEDSAFTLLNSNESDVKHFKLKDIRKMGKAAIQHWIYQSKAH